MFTPLAGLDSVSFGHLSHSSELIVECRETIALHKNNSVAIHN
jgi:hypothetical protein